MSVKASLIHSPGKIRIWRDVNCCRSCRLVPCICILCGTVFFYLKLLVFFFFVLLLLFYFIFSSFIDVFQWQLVHHLQELKSTAFISKLAVWQHTILHCPVGVRVPQVSVQLCYIPTIMLIRMYSLFFVFLFSTDVACHCQHLVLLLTLLSIKRPEERHDMKYVKSYMSK